MANVSSDLDTPEGREFIKKLDSLQTKLNHVSTGVYQLCVDREYREACFAARLFNSYSNTSADKLRPLPTPPARPVSVEATTEVPPPGEPPAFFPATVGDAHRLTDEQVSVLLAAYGLTDQGDLDAKRARLCSFVGCLPPGTAGA
ncbi:uncharacterized protein LOC62_04G005768 [Vanrija pseudolonga]|uniref:Uncharacterized protein n=1 Tax=Vanrija pseudolonga TaxID=143232 RepID=A0AAF1BJ34_9TREE|nr:hypothetical protein LOC62_04G005768 [Vanrija pseudolonga]